MPISLFGEFDGGRPRALSRGSFNDRHVLLMRCTAMQASDGQHTHGMLLVLFLISRFGTWIML